MRQQHSVVCVVNQTTRHWTVPSDKPAKENAPIVVPTSIDVLLVHTIIAMLVDLNTQCIAVF